MKAILCTSFGPPEQLELQDIPEPKTGKGQLKIAVQACSINFPDTLIIRGLYQFRPEPPFSPGSDVAGVILEVGEGVKGFSVGDEVMGIAAYGGFAEQVVLDAKRCLPKPPGMSMPQAAAFLYTYSTSLHALRDRGRLKEGETLVVLGAAGGVGLTAVELGKLMGAKVIAVASTAEKLALCEQYGADATINYTNEDLKQRIKELTDGRGADVILDVVGGPFSEPALRAIAWKGRYLVVGFAAGDIPKIPLNLALLKGCQIVGVFLGRFTQEEPQGAGALFLQLGQWFMEGKLQPHIQRTYSLADAPKAIRAMMDREVMGKVVVVH